MSSARQNQPFVGSYSHRSGSGHPEWPSWQKAMHPAPEEDRNMVLPPSPQSPFLGQYPSTPYLHPVELPQLNSAPIGLGLQNTSMVPRPATPASSVPRASTPRENHSSSSRPRSARPYIPILRAAAYEYGLPSPVSPKSLTLSEQISVHPLLRATASKDVDFVYNVIIPPSLSGANSIHHVQGGQYSDVEFNAMAFHPPQSSIGARVVYGDYSQSPSSMLPWTIVIRSLHANYITLRDVLDSLHLFLLSHVSEQEVSMYTVQQIAQAEIARSKRFMTWFSHVPARDGFLRSDFLFGCTSFAGIMITQDGYLAIKLSTKA